ELSVEGRETDEEAKDAFPSRQSDTNEMGGDLMEKREEEDQSIDNTANIPMVPLSDPIFMAEPQGGEKLPVERRESEEMTDDPIDLPNDQFDPMDGMAEDPDENEEEENIPKDSDENGEVGTRRRSLRLIKKTEPVDYSGAEEEPAPKKLKADIMQKSDKQPIVRGKNEGKTKKSVVCSECGKEYASYQALHYHINTIHLDISVKCWMCFKSFSTNQGLEYHFTTHSGVWLYKCPVCDNPCRTTNSLNQHIRDVHKMKPYSCLTCDSHFNLKSDIKKHLDDNEGHTPRELVRTVGLACLAKCHNRALVRM
ncbi:hypothetical protein PMAYCL1PPCAC_26880, partial [Pristionchus mayeri]